MFPVQQLKFEKGYKRINFYPKEILLCWISQIISRKICLKYTSLLCFAYLSA